MNNIHLHAPQPSRKAVLADTCPDCGKRTRFIGVFTEYYGWDTTCLRCGRNWQDGEWMDLPFMRGAREKSIEFAKKRFRRVVSGSK